MKLKPLALGLALGLFYALCMLFITFYPMFSEAVLGTVQGEGIKALMADIYPYYGTDVWYGTYVGIVFGFIDGFIFGLLVGWLYNVLSREGGSKKKKQK